MSNISVWLFTKGSQGDGCLNCLFFFVVTYVARLFESWILTALLALTCRKDMRLI